MILVASRKLDFLLLYIQNINTQYLKMVEMISGISPRYGPIFSFWNLLEENLKQKCQPDMFKHAFKMSNFLSSYFLKFHHPMLIENGPEDQRDFPSLL